jgi:hypothetical protein
VRQGVPMSIGFLAGVVAYHLLHHLLKNEPHLLNTSMSVIVGFAVSLLTTFVCNRLLGLCWHEHYQDNYREMTPSDYEHAQQQSYQTFS